jgi:hypothetical protein
MSDRLNSEIPELRRLIEKEIAAYQYINNDLEEGYLAGLEYTLFLVKEIEEHGMIGEGRY